MTQPKPTVMSVVKLLHGQRHLGAEGLRLERHGRERGPLKALPVRQAWGLQAPTPRRAVAATEM
jgi:hypothetical protein